MNRTLTEFCSNPKCNYSFDHKPVEPMLKFCTRCGSDMLIKCSKCGKEFPQGTEKYCSDCGTIIKSEDLQV